jgi:hypothetical protein
MCVCAPGCPAACAEFVAVLRDVPLVVAWIDGRVAAEGGFCPGTAHAVSKDIILKKRSFESVKKKRWRKSFF